MTITDIDRLNIHIKLLNSRLDALEEMVRENKPAPQRDTSWHPHNAEVDGQDGYHPKGDKRVVVMTRAGYIARPDLADYRNWHENGEKTIVAWRYAKEGE